MGRATWRRDVLEKCEREETSQNQREVLGLLLTPTFKHHQNTTSRHEERQLDQKSAGREEGIGRWRKRTRHVHASSEGSRTNNHTLNQLHTQDEHTHTHLIRCASGFFEGKHPRITLGTPWNQPVSLEAAPPASVGPASLRIVSGKF